MASAAALSDRSTAPPPLRDRLVAVTLELIAKEGIESLTLRRIARRAGVSHGAPLRHFRSLSDLLAEVAAHGFRLLSAALEDATAGVPAGGGTMARMQASARAYVDVAVENPALFALMFRPDRLDTTNERFVQDSAEAFEHVVRGVRAAQDVGWHAERDTRLLAGVVWSCVHGLASLWSQGALTGPVPDASLEAALAIGLELMHLDPAQADPTPHTETEGTGDPS